MTNNSVSALAALSSLGPTGPRYDLVGPTVDDDIRRVLARYGVEAVKAAVKRQTTAKPGRPRIEDWPELREVIDADAREWLSGGDPFSTRSNYSIAKSFADKNPGQSHPATMKRITRKLERREWQTLAVAMHISTEGYPHAAHMRALEALITLGDHPVWQDMLNEAKMHIADYTAKNGEPPASNLSMREVESGALRSLSSSNVERSA